jgi:hypothetical protein
MYKERDWKQNSVHKMKMKGMNYDEATISTNLGSKSYELRREMQKL